MAMPNGRGGWDITDEEAAEVLAASRRKRTIGFTGTQRGMTVDQVNQVRVLLGADDIRCLHEGDCIGADAVAVALARKAGLLIEVHPPDIEAKRAWAVQPHDKVWPEKPYLVRNRDIVDVTDELIACPRGFVEERMSGTWSTVRYARRKNKRVTIVWPDGRVELEEPVS